jgi:histidinol-phosphatase
VDPDRDDLALALEMAEIADAITRERFLAADLRVATKPDMTPVTEADTAVEQTLRDRLSMARPDDAVLGEEYGSSAEGAQRRWIIDPIDGTKNFVRGIPVWATLIALQEGERMSVGVVSAPALQRRWWASRGDGAYVSDGDGDGTPRRIGVSAVTELADAQLSISGFRYWEERGRLDAALNLIRRCWRTRGFGDFWHHMLVAEGAVDVAVEPVVSLWDLAAPLVIVEEAGGRFTDLAGVATAAGGDAIATNGLIHEPALEVLRR